MADGFDLAIHYLTLCCNKTFSVYELCYSYWSEIYVVDEWSCHQHQKSSTLDRRHGFRGPDASCRAQPQLESPQLWVLEVLLILSAASTAKPALVRFIASAPEVLEP